jgi:hypothetical protein
VKLSKHVTHYGPRSVFLYYNLTTPTERAPTIRHPGRAEQICGFDQYPALKEVSDMRCMSYNFLFLFSFARPVI